MLVGTWLGLPALVATQVSGDVPVVGAVARGEQGAVALTLGLHVRSGRELVAAMTKGNAPTHQATTDAASGLTLLTARPGHEAPPVALGVIGNTLLAALGRADLEQLGPYVGRTLAARSPRESAVVVTVPASALSGAAADAVRSHWQRARAELDRTDRDTAQSDDGQIEVVEQPLDLVLLSLGQHEAHVRRAPLDLAGEELDDAQLGHGVPPRYA